MTWLIGLLSPRVLIGLAIAVAVAFAAAWLRHSGFKAGAQSVQVVLEQERAAWATERAKAVDAARQQAEKFLAKQAADAEQLDKVQTHAQTLIAAAVADRGAADRKSASLQRTADLALDSLRRGTPEAPATAAECEAANAAARVFRDLFGRADEVAGVLAAAADDARIAGNACVRADAVTR